MTSPSQLSRFISLGFASALLTTAAAAQATSLFGFKESDTVASVRVRWPHADIEDVTDGVADGDYAMSIQDGSVRGILYATFKEARKGWFSRDDYRSTVRWVRWMPGVRLTAGGMEHLLGLTLTDCRQIDGNRVCRGGEKGFFVKLRTDGTVLAVDVDFSYP